MSWLRELERQRRRRSSRLRLSSLASRLGDAFVAPAPDQAGKRAGHVFRQPQRLADFAHRAARAVAR